MNNDALILKKFCMYTFSIFYIWLYTCLPSSWFRDRLNYEEMAKYSNELIALYQGYNTLIIHEPIFLFLNKFLIVFFDPEMVPHVFVFFITSMLCLFLIKISKNFTLFFLGLLAFVTVPFMFHLQLVVLRQALATVVFIWGVLNIRSEKNFSIFILITPFLHASFFLILLIYFTYIFLKKYINNRLYLSLIAGLCIYILFKFSMVVASYLNIYQLGYIGDYELDVSGRSLLLYIFIYGIMVYMLSPIKDRLSDMTLVFLTTYIFLYLVTPLIGRYMVTFFPFIILSLVRNNKIENYIILIVLIILYSYVSYNGALIENSLLLSSLSEIGIGL
ncbi:MAG: EpsG family protein [Acinetobacter calcoaceticus]